MSRTFKAVLMIVCILMQITVLAHITPWGILPNYILVVLIATVLISPDTESVIIAGIAGALTDIFTGTAFGVNTLLCMYSAVVLVIISTNVYTRRVTYFAPVCFAVSFIYELIFGIISFLLRDTVFEISSIRRIVLPVAAVNAVIFIPVYEILRRVKTEKKRKGIKYER